MKGPDWAAVVGLEPLIVRRVATELTRRGVNVSDVFSGLDVDPASLGDPACLVSALQTRSVVLRAMRALQDKHLGLHLGATVNPVAWGDCLLLLMASRDTHEMLALFSEFVPSPRPFLHLTCDDTAAGRWLVVESMCGDEDLCAFLTEKTLAALVQVGRRLAGDEFKPLHVELNLPGSDASAAHDTAMGCRVKFGASESKVLFPKPPTPLASADSVTVLRLASRLRSSGRIEAGIPSIQTMVRRLLQERLLDPPTLGEVANEMHVSERTLHRLLAALGQSYAGLLDQVRMNCALGLIRGGEHSLAQAARASGFADPRSLRRAVKRWTGLSPSELLAKQQKDALRHGDKSLRQ